MWFDMEFDHHFSQQLKLGSPALECHVSSQRQDAYELARILSASKTYAEDFDPKAKNLRALKKHQPANSMI